jgi:hypothetical protein
MSASFAKQLCIFLENKPGVLSRLCRALAGARINLKAISVLDSLDHAVVRLVVDKPAAARRLFEDHHLLVIENDLLALSLPDRPGELGRVAARLAKARINITYVFGSAPDGMKRGTIYLRVEAPRSRVVAALKGL